MFKIKKSYEDNSVYIELKKSFFLSSVYASINNKYIDYIFHDYKAANGLYNYIYKYKDTSIGINKLKELAEKLGGIKQP